MAIIKCKMCGGDLTVTEGEKIAECEYCGSKQTVPDGGDEKKVSLFNRANRLRIHCEFDKAASIYEQIVADFPEEAEAYWGLCLCNYGIEYVDDPATAKKIPTCHRASFEQLRKDGNYELALENADPTARALYQEEAKEIDRIRGEILSVSRNEQPYDIFICYKESDNSGNRTPDSVLAQDIYDALTAKGYKVFFSRISLEDKLGQQYEPYIFAALDSAKIMLVVGTDYEYMNAVWVKNEWSRFLKLTAKDKTRTLIPCYKDMDPYDMPDEFRGLQSQDCGKLGYLQDLTRGIDKLFGKEAGKPAPAAPAPTGSQTASLLKRAFLFLEDENWDSAIEYCNKTLDADPENAEAYLGLAMAKTNCSDRAEFEDEYVHSTSSADISNELKRAGQFSAEMKDWFAELDQKMAKYKAEEAARKEWEREAKNERLATLREPAKHFCRMIAAGRSHTVGLQSDGTVVATKFSGNLYFDQCDVSGWKDIVAISAGNDHTVGLKADGTVVAVGSDFDGQCNVSGWKDIVAISAGHKYTVGLKADGTAVAAGRNFYGQCNVSGWKDIVAISAGHEHTVGLKADGTAVAVGMNSYGQCDVSGWTNIVAISAGSSHTVGLKADGTAVAAGRNFYGKCNVSHWKNIVAISAGYSHTVGLKADGTADADGNNDNGRCDVSCWTDIVAISAYCGPGSSHTVGLKADGTVVAVGDNDSGQCSVSAWKLFKSDAEKEADYQTACTLQAAASENDLSKAATLFKGLRTYRDSAERAAACSGAYEEKKAARERYEWQQAIPALTAEKNALIAELQQLKGLFTGKRRREIETRLAQIDTLLRR